MNNLTFRKHYIGNVRLSETGTKQALCNILGEKPIDINKLTQFTLKTTLPSNYRPVVWKLLSGITPCFVESQEFVHQQHVLMFEDLFRALKVLRLGAPISQENGEPNGHSHLGTRTSFRLCRNAWNGHLNEINNPEPEHFFLMWLISEARLLRDPETQLNAPESQRYIFIGHKLHCGMDDPVDRFHICCSLWTLLRKSEDKIKACVQAAIGLLRKKNDHLHLHLNQIGLFAHPLLEEHSLSLFCEIFAESSIEKIIDKIFAGNFNILTDLIVALLCQLQHNLYISTSVESVRNILYQVRKEQADIVITATLDIWHRKEERELYKF